MKLPGILPFIVKNLSARRFSGPLLSTMRHTAKASQYPFISEHGEPGIFFTVDKDCGSYKKNIQFQNYWKMITIDDNEED